MIGVLTYHGRGSCAVPLDAEGRKGVIGPETAATEADPEVLALVADLYGQRIRTGKPVVAIAARFWGCRTDQRECTYSAPGGRAAGARRCRMPVKQSKMHPSRASGRRDGSLMP